MTCMLTFPRDSQWCEAQRPKQSMAK